MKASPDAGEPRAADLEPRARGPVVHAYSDYRQFLQDWHRADQNRAEPAGWTGLAEGAGCSAGYLQNVAKERRRPSPRLITAIGEALGFAGETLAYWGLLAQFTHADTPAERARLLPHLTGLRRKAGVMPLEGEQFHVLSSLVCSTLYELARLPGFEPDPAWILPRLRLRSSASEVAAALDSLRAVGLLGPDGRAGQLEDVVLRTSDALKEASSLAIYHAALGRAAEDPRQGLLMLAELPEELLPQLMELVDEFQDRLNRRLEALQDQPLEGGRVVQIVSAAVPRTTPYTPRSAP